MRPKNWQDWHHAYDDPQSSLSQRLAAIINEISSALDRANPGEIRLLSLCAGDGRDVRTALAGHPRRRDVRGALIELDPILSDTARMGLSDINSRLEVWCSDAGDGAILSRADPADLLLLCGIFGNISDADINQTIRRVPSLARPGATIIWTRHRRSPDVTPAILEAFADIGCTHLSLASPGSSAFFVGVERFNGATQTQTSPTRLFTFLDRFRA